MKTINIEGKDFTIEQLKELINKEENKPNWRDNFKGMHYPHLDSDGKWIVGDMFGIHPNHYEERDHVPIEKIALLCDMTEWARVHNEGWVANWSNGEQKKWGVAFNDGVFFVCFAVLYNSLVFQIALKSEELAEQFYEEFKGRLHIINKQ